MSGLPAAAPGHVSPRGRRRASGHHVPRVVAGTSLLVAGALLLPVVFLISEAAQVGRAQMIRLLLRHLTATLLVNTAVLTARSPPRAP